MDLDFCNKIEQHLKELNLTRKQLCQFAWLCGVRVLPFLAFARWPEEDTQKYLYSVFNALDVNARVTFLDHFTDADVDAIAAAVASADAAVFTSLDAAYIANTAARTVAYAANAISTVVYTTNAATRAAAHAAACAAVAYATKFAFDGVLINDINAITKNKLNGCNHNIAAYGDVWDKFHEYLEANGCAYWARLYENLFNKGFDKLDTKELRRRLGVPDEIKAEGAATVGRYLEGLGNKTERLNEARIIILGEKGAGKTSLARKLLDINAKLPQDDESTEGVETRLWHFTSKDGADVNAHVWDFAGHSITHSAHRCFMSARCLYIYVYNGRIERDNDPRYWLEQIRIYGGDDCPVLFLINEKDVHVADIEKNTLKKEYPSIVDYYHINIKEDKTKLEEFRQTVQDTVCNNPSWNSQLVSEEAYKIKSELRKYFEETEDPHITLEQFEMLAKKCGAQAGQIKDILNYLHTLGICLWYDKDDMEEFKLLVLNPDWITNGIYRIINKGKEEDSNMLSVDKGTELLQNDKNYKYPSEKVRYLFRLMRLYELAFFKDTDHIFIPGILPMDMADGLPAFDDASGRLIMVFKVENVLPPNIVSRIIVQRHEFGEIFKEELLWRKGAVLKYKGSDAIALIVEDNRSVTVKVKGAGKTAYIASLRDTIKVIFESYKVVKPDLLYEVLVPENHEKGELPNRFEKEKPLMASEVDIIGLLQMAIPYITDTLNKRKIPLDRTTAAYNVINIFNGTTNLEQEVKNMENSGNTTKIDNSPITNSAVNMGAMDNSPQTVNVNATMSIAEISIIDDWIRKITEELEKSNNKDDELTSAIDTLRDAIQKPKPNKNIIQAAIDAIKNIGYGIISSAAWQHLMTNPPM